MKLTNKQIKDIESIIWFIPNDFKDVSISEQDKVGFQMMSTHGKKFKSRKKGKLDNIRDGFNALKQGKIRRGLHMQLWEDGVVLGLVPYFVLLGGEDYVELPPRSVVDFAKKEMFKGSDSELIETLYLDNLKYWTWWRKVLFRISKLI